MIAVQIPIQTHRCGCVVEVVTHVHQLTAQTAHGTQYMHTSAQSHIPRFAEFPGQLYTTSSTVLECGNKGDNEVPVCARIQGHCVHYDIMYYGRTILGLRVHCTDESPK